MQLSVSTLLDVGVAQPPYFVCVHVPGSGMVSVEVEHDNVGKELKVPLINLEKDASFVGVFVWARDPVQEEAPNAYALQGQVFFDLFSLAQNRTAKSDMAIGNAVTTTVKRQRTGEVTLTVVDLPEQAYPSHFPQFEESMRVVNRYCSGVSTIISDRYQNKQVNLSQLGAWLFNDTFIPFPPFMARVPMWAFIDRATDAHPSESEEGTLEALAAWCELRAKSNEPDELLNEMCTFFPLALQYRSDHTGVISIDQWESPLHNPVFPQAGVDCEDVSELMIHVFYKIKNYDNPTHPVLKKVKAFIADKDACMASVSLVTVDVTGDEKKGFHAAVIVVPTEWLHEVVDCARKNAPIPVPGSITMLEGTGYVGVSHEAFRKNESPIDWWMKQPLRHTEWASLKQHVAVSDKKLGTYHEHLFVIHAPQLAKKYDCGDIMFEADGILGVPIRSLADFANSGSIKAFIAAPKDTAFTKIHSAISEMLEMTRSFYDLPELKPPTDADADVLTGARYLYWCPSFIEHEDDARGLKAQGGSRHVLTMGGGIKMIVWKFSQHQYHG